MSRINVSRVIIGGLAAGVTANALDFVINKYLLAAEATEMIQRLNLKPDQVEGSVVAWIVADFVYGMILVFTYAAMRPRFGPGPKTAMIAAISYWLAFTAVFGGLMAMGIYTQQAYIKTSALTVVSSIVPALVGAWLYKEDDAE
jgi:uncharacterized membrane protein HdeD (DUF308 family)